MCRENGMAAHAVGCSDLSVRHSRQMPWELNHSSCTVARQCRMALTLHGLLQELLHSATELSLTSAVMHHINSLVQLSLERCALCSRPVPVAARGIQVSA